MQPTLYIYEANKLSYHYFGSLLLSKSYLKSRFSRFSLRCLDVLILFFCMTSVWQDPLLSYLLDQFIVIFWDIFFWLYLAIDCLPSAMPNIQKSRMLVKWHFLSLDYLSGISYFYYLYLYLYLRIFNLSLIYLIISFAVSLPKLISELTL